MYLIYNIESLANQNYISFNFSMILTFSENALREWITGETIYARTHRGMTDNMTVSVRTAGTNARILTFLINASQVISAFAITDALCSAIRRIADKIG